MIDGIKYRIDYLDNNAVLEFVRQVEIDAPAELADVVLNVGAADAGVNGVNVDLGIVRINGDEVCGDFLIRADDRGVNLDLDVGLVDLQSALDRLGGTELGAALGRLRESAVHLPRPIWGYLTTTTVPPPTGAQAF